MALSGLFIEFTYATDDGNKSPTALSYKPVSSTTIVSAGVSSAAPNNGPEGDRPIARLISSEAGYYKIGPSVADASSSPRGYLPAGEVREIYVESGDKISWLTA